MTLWRSDSDGAIALSILKHEIEGIKVKCPCWASGLCRPVRQALNPSQSRESLPDKEGWARKGVWAQIITRSRKIVRQRGRGKRSQVGGLSVCLWMVHRATVWNRIHGEVSRGVWPAERVQGASVLSTSWRPPPQGPENPWSLLANPQRSTDRRTVRAMTSTSVTVSTHF